MKKKEFMAKIAEFEKKGNITNSELDALKKLRREFRLNIGLRVSDELSRDCLRHLASFRMRGAYSYYQLVTIALCRPEDIFFIGLYEIFGTLYPVYNVNGMKIVKAEGLERPFIIG